MTDCEEEVWLGSGVRTQIPFVENYPFLLAEAQFNFDAQQQTPVADGQPNSPWEDFGPNGYDAGASTQIKYFSSGINGFPAFNKAVGPPGGVSMPNAADNIGLPADGLTLFVVHQGSDNGKQLIGKWSGPTGRHWRLGTGANTGVQTLEDVLDPDEQFANVDDADARIDLLRWEPDILGAVYKNGVLQNAAVDPATTCEIGTGNIEIFVDGNGNSYFGWIGQIIGFAPFLTVTQINTVMQGLSAAWSIAVTPL